MKIPNNNLWRQENAGDKFPDLWSTYNIDLTDEQGKLKISPRLMLNTGSADDSDLKVPFAFTYNDSLAKWHAGCGAVMFVGGDSPSDAFTQDAASSPPSFETTARPDLATYNISGTDFTYGMSAELFKLNSAGTSWSQITSLGGSSGGAPLIAFQGRLYYRISINQMGSINSSDTPVAPNNTYALNIDDFHQAINCGTKTGDFIYLGTVASPGTKAIVYEWDGASTSVRNAYEIDAQGVLAMTTKFGIPWLIDSKGVLRKFNGGAFEEIARLPFRKKKLLPRPYQSAAATAHIVHYNGMTNDDDNIYINVMGTYADTNSTTDEKVPSGVWIYNDKNGLFHHSSPSAWKNGTSSTETDYGAMKVAKIGAVKIANHFNTADNGNLLAGYDYYTDATTTASGIFFNDLNDTVIKYGNFVSYWMEAVNIRESWQKAFVKIRKLLNSSDKIIMRYRMNEDAPLQITGTWVSTSTFNTTTDLSAYIGAEVEVLNGTGSGKSAHITAVTFNTPNWLITLNDTFTGVTSGTFLGRVQTWIYSGSFSKQYEEVPEFTFPKGNISARIQLKVSIQCTGKNELFEVQLDNIKQQ